MTFRINAGWKKCNVWVLTLYCCSEEKMTSNSQPEPGTGLSLWDNSPAQVDKLVQGFSFSQPACPEHMLLNSQFLGTPSSSQVTDSHNVWCFLCAHKLAWDQLAVFTYPLKYNGCIYKPFLISERYILKLHGKTVHRFELALK